MSEYTLEAQKKEAFYMPIQRTCSEELLILKGMICGGKAMANYPQELAQDAVCQSHTGHMTGLWFLPSPVCKAEY